MSYLFYKISTSTFKKYLWFLILAYFLFTYLTLFYLNDFIGDVLRKCGIIIHYSHNDLVSIFVVISLCMLAFIVVVVYSLYKRKKLVHSK